MFLKCVLAWFIIIVNAVLEVEVELCYFEVFCAKHAVWVKLCEFGVSFVDELTILEIECVVLIDLEFCESSFCQLELLGSIAAVELC